MRTKMEQKSVNTEIGWLWAGLWKRGGWGANWERRCCPDSAACSGQCNLHTPSREGCNSARGPRGVGGPWDPWRKQRHLLHRESPWLTEQPPGPGNCFPLKDRTAEKKTPKILFCTPRRRKWRHYCSNNKKKKNLVLSLPLNTSLATIFSPYFALFNCSRLLSKS